MRNIDGIQVIGTDCGKAIFVGFDRDLIIVDENTDSVYINPTSDVFLLLANKSDDKYNFLYSCYASILTQVPFILRDFNLQYTKLRTYQRPPIDWDKVYTFIKKSMNKLVNDSGLDKFASDIFIALQHICEDYPQELINNYKVRVKGE